MTLCAAAAGTYLAARLVGTWELYLLSFAFLALLLIAWLLVTATARKLEAERSVLPRQPRAGDPLSITCRVKNCSRLPGLQATLRNAAGRLAGDDVELQFASLGPRAERVATSGVLVARRGVHRLPALQAELEDPLGLARTRRRFGEPVELTVYPRLVDLPSCTLFAGMGARRERGRRGLAMLGASEFRGVRPHNPGEPLSRVDWKATAKTGNLMLREMDDPMSGDLTLLLDGSVGYVVGEPPETNLELAVQVAGSVADYALRRGRGVGLLLPQNDWRRTRVSPDSDGRRRLLESLARVAPHATVRLGPSLRSLLAHGGRLAPMQVVTLVILHLDREIVRAVIDLREQGVQVSLVHVVGGSFVATAPPPATAAVAIGAENEGLLLALAAAGVRCLTVGHGDDLRLALSLRRADEREAVVR